MFIAYDITVWSFDDYAVTFVVGIAISLLDAKNNAISKRSNRRVLR
jgi:hypothetical protein